MDEISGVIVIDKHEGVTSHDIVNKIRRLFGTRRVGHTGTLDPMATGVLPILVGRAAKAAEYLVSEDKTYTAGIRLGVTTDTQDTTGTVLSRCESLPDAETFFRVCHDFVGSYDQLPPMYSALKVGGKKLVDLAREGVEVERTPRPVTIHSLAATAVDPVAGEYRITVHCSKGTYIRTLCDDIGRALGCGAAMSSLRREASGGFTLQNAYTVEELEAKTVGEREALLLPTEALFSALPAVCLPDFYARLSRNGAEIYLRKIRADLPVGERVALYDKDGFYAIGEVREYPEGPAIKTAKLFVL